MSQQDLIVLRKPTGTLTSCHPQHLQIYLNKGFTVVDGAEDLDDVIEDEVIEDTDDEVLEDGDE